MHIAQLRDFCLSKKGVTEHFPFDNVTLVFKVMNKIFALLRIDKWEQGAHCVNLKCDPEKAEELREVMRVCSLVGIQIKSIGIQ